MPMVRNIVIKYKHQDWDYSDLTKYLRDVASELESYTRLGYAYNLVEPPKFEIEMVHPNVFAIEPTGLAKLIEQPVLTFKWSSRTKNCLTNSEIKTVRELVLETESEMLKIRNFGRKSLNEVKNFLSEHRLSLGMREEWITRAIEESVQQKP